MLFYENGKQIYKNLQGKEIPPHLWKTMNTFYEGLVTVVDENDHYGFADEEGNMVFPPKWDYACYFEKGWQKRTLRSFEGIQGWRYAFGLRRA